MLIIRTPYFFSKPTKPPVKIVHCERLYSYGFKFQQSSIRIANLIFRNSNITTCMNQARGLKYGIQSEFNRSLIRFKLWLLKQWMQRCTSGVSYLQYTGYLGCLSQVSPFLDEAKTELLIGDVTCYGCWTRNSFCSILYREIIKSPPKVIPRHKWSMNFFLYYYYYYFKQFWHKWENPLQKGP